jgi:hypothetical protein
MLLFVWCSVIVPLSHLHCCSGGGCRVHGDGEGVVLIPVFIVAISFQFALPVMVCHVMAVL